MKVGDRVVLMTSNGIGTPEGARGVITHIPALALADTSVQERIVITVLFDDDPDVRLIPGNWLRVPTVVDKLADLA